MERELHNLNWLRIKELVPERAGKDKIDAIIKEELGHLAVLNLSLAASK